MWRLTVVLLLLTSVDCRPKSMVNIALEEYDEEVVDLVLPVSPKTVTKKHVRAHAHREELFFMDGYGRIAFMLPPDYLKATLNISTPSSPPER